MPMENSKSEAAKRSRQPASANMNNAATAGKKRKKKKKDIPMTPAATEGAKFLKEGDYLRKRTNPGEEIAGAHRA